MPGGPLVFATPDHFAALPGRRSRRENYGCELAVLARFCEFEFLDEARRVLAKPGSDAEVG